MSDQPSLIETLSEEINSSMKSTYLLVQDKTTQVTSQTPTYGPPSLDCHKKKKKAQNLQIQTNKNIWLIFPGMSQTH